MVILREENVRLQKDCKHTCTSSIDPNHAPTEANVIITSQIGTLSDNSHPSSSSSDSDIDTVEEFQLTTAQLNRQKKLERRATKHRVNQKIVNTNTNVEGIPATTSNVEEVPSSNNQLRAATHAADVVPSVSNQLHVRAADTRDTCDICVGQVHPNCDTDMIHKHLTSLGARHNTQIQSLTRATNAKWRSYKVTVSCTLQDKVLNIDNWPSGIVVQPFRDNKKPRQGPFREKKNHNRRPFVTIKSHSMGHRTHIGVPHGTPRCASQREDGTHTTSREMTTGTSTRPIPVGGTTTVITDTSRIPNIHTITDTTTITNTGPSTGEDSTDFTMISYNCKGFKQSVDAISTMVLNCDLVRPVPKYWKNWFRLP